MNVKHLTGLLALLFVLTITACTEGGSQPASGGGNPPAAITDDDAARVTEVMEAFITAYTSGGDVSPYVMDGTFDDRDLKFQTVNQHGELLSAWVEPDSVEFWDAGRYATIDTIWDCEDATIRVPFDQEPDADGNWKIVKSSSVTDVIEEKVDPRSRLTP